MITQGFSGSYFIGSDAGPLLQCFGLFSVAQCNLCSLWLHIRNILARSFFPHSICKESSVTLGCFPGAGQKVEDVAKGYPAQEYEQKP